MIIIKIKKILLKNDKVYYCIGVDIMKKEERVGCIYCGKENDLTESDIVPDALTNARITNSYVCHVDHNSKMTERFESKVAEELAFLTNELNIKSSKSSHYAKYTAIYVIQDIEYKAKNIVTDEDFIKRTIWSSKEDGIEALGPMEEIKKIAINKMGNDKDVKHVDLNSNEIIKKVNINLDIFCQHIMYRQVAKIAFELYCAQNDVKNHYAIFDKIIDFIVMGKGDDIVKIIMDKGLLKEFDSICTDGGHCIVTYIADDGSINAFVDMFGIAVYNVKICDKINDMCQYNCSLQILNIDSSRALVKCKDYNDAFEQFTDQLINSKSIENSYIKELDLTLNAVQPTSNNIHYLMFLMNLPQYIKKGFEVWNNNKEELQQRIVTSINKLFEYSILSKRLLKRFTSEKELVTKLVKLNPNGSNKKDLFLFYVIFLIGKFKLLEFNYKKLIDLLYDNLKSESKYEYRMTDENFKQILLSLLSDDEYSNYIKNGAVLIQKWK